MTTREPVVLLLTSGYHLYREYLLAQVAGSAGVWLLQDEEPTWQKPYLVGHSVVSTLDVEATVAAARQVTARHQVTGVVCWDEVRMRHAAELATALGVPGPDPEAVTRCRDKHLTRTSLAAGNVPSARSVLVGSSEQAVAAADSIGYPVVLKPRALGASFGVVGVSTADELAEGYRLARLAEEDGVPYYADGVLVEEYLTGPEISVDCAVIGGQVLPLFLARKVSGYPPYFEEVGHTVDADDPLLADPRLLAVLDDAHRAVGYTGGITHVELRRTAAGPRIVEINSRLGGDFIPYVAHFASGVDAGAAAVAVSSGGMPAVPRGSGRVAAVRFLYPDRDVTVDGVTVDEDRLPHQVVAHGVLAQPGQELRLPPAGHVTCRYGYVITAGESATECLAAAETAEQAFLLRAIPLTA